MTPSVRFGFPPIAGRLVRPRGRRLLFVGLVLSAAVAAGCRKTPEDWLDHLLHGDEFERRMAVTALREVEDDKLRPALRALLAAMQDRDVEVAQAARESVVALAHRDLDGYLMVIRQVHQQGQRWHDVSVRTLRDLYPETRSNLWVVFHDPTDPVRELLGEVIRHEGPEAVEAALEMLAHTGLKAPASLTE